MIGKIKASRDKGFRRHLYGYLVNLGDPDAAVAADDLASLRQFNGLVDALGMDDGVA